MIGYILIIVLCPAIWVLFHIADKKNVDWAGALLLCLGTISTVVLVTSTIYIATKRADAEDFISERGWRQDIVYSISDTMSPQTVSKIITEATYYNNRIEKNKKHCDSKMWGFAYNKGIATAKPIDIPKYTFKVVREDDEY